MSNKNEGKSQAEIYREERKARLAKAAKKNAAKTPEMVHKSKVAVKIICMCLAAVIVILIAGLIVKETGLVEKNVTALKVGDTKVSIAEYQYYYSSTYYNLLNYTVYYDQMGGYGKQITGLDSTKLPAKQEYTGTEIPESEGIENPTMEDYIAYSTKLYIQNIVMLYNEAVANGITLSEEEIAEVNAQIEEGRTTAEENNFSFNAYLKQFYKVKSLNEESYTDIMMREALSSKYNDMKEAEFKKEIEDNNLVQAKYDEAKDDYDLVDVVIYTVTGKAETLAEDATEEQKAAANDAAGAQAKAEAEDFLSKVTSADSITTLAEAKELGKNVSELESSKKSSIVSSYSEDVANWVFDDARTAGDKTVIEKITTTTDEDGNVTASTTPSLTYYVVYLKTPQYLSTSADVRHILIKFATDDTADTADTATATEEVSAEVKAAALKKAEEVLAEWKNGDATEESFTALVSTYSEDTGSVEDGGLYEGVTRDSNYVENFLGWIFDTEHKAGDTGIVETEYGYHIMYYSADNGAAWTQDITDTLVSEKTEAFSTSLSESETYAITANNYLISYAVGLSDKFVKYWISNPPDFSNNSGSSY